ncbi:hypothetical protein [Flavobacterium sp.]|uniref:hypothetical protein n=1 Tax=Flavobacterium sp. TaxID=239 RepID=UPI003752095A
MKNYSETPIVKGFNRSCIYDLPRQNYDLVSNHIVDKLDKLSNLNFEDLIKTLNVDEIEWVNFFLIKEYYFLISNEFSNSFPKINFEWHYPFLINNCIIEITNIKLNVLKIFSRLEDINCKHLLIKFNNIENTNEIIDFLKLNLENLTFKSIDLIIEDNKNKKINLQNFYNLVKKEIAQITSIKTNPFFKINELYFKPQFLVNINMFSESKSYNVYYNRKLYIDDNGHIKNGIETTKSFGNIYSSIENFEKIIKSKKFKSLSKINKDKIDVCKDCEFRYMCIDNRIPLKRDDNTYFFQKECSYNPYISKWHIDENYKSLTEVGVYSNEKEFYINIKKVQNYNNIVWKDA